MHCLIVMRRLPDKNALRLAANLIEALTAQGHQLDGLFLMGPAVCMVQREGSYLEQGSRMTYINQSKELKRLLALAEGQGFDITACGRSLQNHDISTEVIEPPFAAGGYYELLQKMQGCERVIEI
ncbi:MAG: DsrE family protein [Proteobacteria bacterium]|uniref:DsrE family protein n=1 Tax=Candidatus Avisuccinivibrio stercorigallinarum TaxID=2840704 RepID=A0A9D9D999_9GAMM|nr:DsrE family protein [Candidatus Avisuccinivibrio stercorigallinarum]